MNDNQVLKDIVITCLSIDRKAAGLYKEMSLAAADEELAGFWRKMSSEEMEHVGFWETMQALAEDGVLPQVFEDPVNTRFELQEINRKIDELWPELKKSPDIHGMFLLAYRMEFYLLHRAFETLFHLARTISDEENPEATYNQHISEFIEGFTRYGELTPEMELLGETLKHLWIENRAAVKASNTDELTEVLNRRGFFNAVKPLLYMAQRDNNNVGVLLADVDDFKKINDDHGHYTGDELLRLVARVIKTSVRASDVVGRYGGEEFIIFFSTVRKGAVSGIAAKIQEQLKREDVAGIRVTLSIGIADDALGMDVEQELRELIKRADDNMYMAKRSGKDQIFMNDSQVKAA